MKTLKLLKIPAVLGLFFVLISATTDGSKETERVHNASNVLLDFGKLHETIPHNLMSECEGIVIIPKLINAGFVVGGKRGRGVAMVKMDDGKWSDPVFVTMTGGSIGAQIGYQSVDLVLSRGIFFIGYFVFAKARFNSTPDIADIPPTMPPINAVTIRSNIQFGNWKSVATRLASMLSLGTVLNSARTVHTINTPKKPAKNDFAGVLPINNAGKKAAIATTHQGRKYPLAKVNIRMMKNSIFSPL
jgi:hypothetical protein